MPAESLDGVSVWFAGTVHCGDVRICNVQDADCLFYGSAEFVDLTVPQKCLGRSQGKLYIGHDARWS